MSESLCDFQPRQKARSGGWAWLARRSQIRVTQLPRNQSDIRIEMEERGANRVIMCDGHVNSEKESVE